MLYFASWKRALVVLTCLAGVLFAAPNLFDEQGRASIPSWLPTNAINLGLDLQGGAHLLVTVEVEDVYSERIEQMGGDMRSALRRASVLEFSPPAVDESGVSIRITDPAQVSAALSAVEDLSGSVVDVLVGASTDEFEIIAEGQVLTASLTEAARADILTRTMSQSLEIIRRRIDETGTREPTIQRQGERRILIQVPGAESSKEVLDLIGRTAKLTFHEVVSAVTDPRTRPGAGEMILHSADEGEQGVFYVLERRPTVSGERLVDARLGFDQNGLPAVDFRFDAAGGAAFGKYTQENVGNRFAIVLDGEVISAPRIITAILGGAGQITGSFNTESATTLAILLRSGALPAEIKVLEERTVGPVLGADSIAAGKAAAVVAGVAVLVFMVLSYGWFGLLADIALTFNVAMIFGLLSAIGATLTLPGVAGIVLTIGMAVDANVLIFERIREELKRVKKPAQAIETGYDRAFSAIIDANVTTFIVAVILFAMGAGPVRGFSVTLGVGILTSVFTAVLVTRFFIVLWMQAKRPKQIAI